MADLFSQQEMDKRKHDGHDHELPLKYTWSSTGMRPIQIHAHERISTKSGRTCKSSLV